MTRTQRACLSLVLISTIVAMPAEAALARPAPTEAAPIRPASVEASPVRVLPSASAAAGLTVYGYGRRTAGGRSGRTIYVTNRKGAGRGSLRAALEAKGRRIVRFRVAGTISLQTPIKIKWPYITVAGNLAPGKGVQVRGAPLVVVTHDVILKHLRVRVGDAGLSSSEAGEYDSVTINGVGKNVYNVILDHMSLTWGPDIGGLAILGNVHHVSVQNSIMGEGLRYSRHPEGRGEGHSTAVNLTPMKTGQGHPDRITFFRNLFTTSDERMPRVIGASCVDLINNLIFNWGTHAASGNPRSLNLIGNWFRKGPRMSKPYTWWPTTAGDAPHFFRRSVFLRSNHSDAGRRAPNNTVYANSARCGGASVRARPVGTVMATVLNTVGARQPMRDTVDRRVISNARHRLGRFFNGVGHPKPNPYWPSLTN
jgi:pectate lyase